MKNSVPLKYYLMNPYVLALIPFILGVCSRVYGGNIYNILLYLCIVPLSIAGLSFFISAINDKGQARSIYFLASILFLFIIIMTSVLFHLGQWSALIV